MEGKLIGILVALAACLSVANACKREWANHCDDNNPCCAGLFCDRPSNWRHGVCKKGQGGGGNTQSPPNNGGGGSKSGICSWYGEDGEIPPNWPTACGTPFNPNEMATAHPDLPCGTRLRVTANNRFVDVVVNDRGPHVAGRILDLTKAAFKVVEPDTGKGLIQCSYVVL